MTVRSATWSCRSNEGARNAKSDKRTAVNPSTGARYRVTALERPAIMIVDEREKVGWFRWIVKSTSDRKRKEKEKKDLKKKKQASADNEVQSYPGTIIYGSGSRPWNSGAHEENKGCNEAYPLCKLLIVFVMRVAKVDSEIVEIPCFYIQVLLQKLSIK